MNEVKLSTQIQPGQTPRLSIKLNVKELGLSWKEHDIIRVLSYKKDGTIVLKKVGVKAKKTVAHTLTKTGSGTFKHELGIYVSHKVKRFRNEFKPAMSISAGVRFIDDKKTLLQIFMPRDIFQNEKCFN
jgi:hypothetical protein